MSDSTYYITYVSIGYWPITRPKRTSWKANVAAENQASRELLQERGINPPSSNYRSWLLRNYPEIVEAARGFIGATVSVSLETEEKPREFREKFCSPSINLQSWLSVVEDEC